MMERRDPFSRMLSLRQMMDRLMEDAFVMPRDALMSGLSAMSGGTQMDVFEEGDSFVVEAQLPGYRPEDIDISVERGTLTIKGESRAQEERKDRQYLVREQRAGSFQRSIQLPSTVDPDACQAMFEHGILRLTFPRAEQARPRRIEISTGSPAGTGGSVSVGGTRSSGGDPGLSPLGTTSGSGGPSSGGATGDAPAGPGGTGTSGSGSTTPSAGSGASAPGSGSPAPDRAKSEPSSVPGGTDTSTGAQLNDLGMAWTPGGGVSSSSTSGSGASGGSTSGGSTPGGTTSGGSTPSGTRATPEDA